MGSRRARTEQGTTLVEVLVAVVILGLAGVGITAGMMLSVKASDIHRKQSTGGSEVRTYADLIEKWVLAGNYTACAAASAYTPGDVGYAVPAGYQAGLVGAAVPLDGNGAAAGGTCPTKDTGIQRLRLSVHSTDGRADEQLTVVVRKACGTGTSCP